MLFPRFRHFPRFCRFSPVRPTWLSAEVLPRIQRVFTTGSKSLLFFIWEVLAPLFRPALWKGLIFIRGAFRLRTTMPSVQPYSCVRKTKLRSGQAAKLKLHSSNRLFISKLRPRHSENRRWVCGQDSGAVIWKFLFRSLKKSRARICSFSRFPTLPTIS